jgi:PAS domain S-box-containing protein
MAMLRGHHQDAQAVREAAATRTRSGITTRLGGARLKQLQSMAAPAAAPSSVGGSAQGQGQGRRGAAAAAQAQAQAQQQQQRKEEEYSEDEEENDEDGEEDEEEGVGGTGGGRRRKKSKLTMKPLTEQQRVERRERNREHAKRSRMRKKFMLESLQAQMQALRKENLRLRQAVATKIPEKAETILRSCSSIKTQNMLSPVELGHHRALADNDGKLISALQFAQQNFTVSDPSLPDNPIVYASQGFLDLTGYRSDQIVGRNCRFLQGPGTDPAAVDIIRRGVALGEDTSVCLLNYRADGTPFWNQFFVAALRDSDGAIVNYVGVQCEVAEAPMEEELKERVKTINFDEEEE